jgi:hypothetical protein
MISLSELTTFTAKIVKRRGVTAQQRAERTWTPEASSPPSA